MAVGAACQTLSAAASAAQSTPEEQKRLTENL